MADMTKKQVAGLARVFLHETMELRERLDHIARIIDIVDNRCLASDGPVPRTVDEMTDSEMREIYKLASGKRSKPSKKAAASKKKKSSRK